MEQILIQVSNKEKAKILLELLESLDFVDFIEVKVKEESDAEKISPLNKMTSLHWPACGQKEASRWSQFAGKPGPDNTNDTL